MNKFRVYDTVEKRYVTDERYWFIKPNGELMYRTFFNNILHDENCIYEMYIGIVDKNKQDIYEGDVLQCDSWEFDGTPIERTIAVTDMYNTEIMGFLDYGCENIEIIKTIHD